MESQLRESIHQHVLYVCMHATKYVQHFAWQSCLPYHCSQLNNLVWNYACVCCKGWVKSVVKNTWKLLTKNAKEKEQAERRSRNILCNILKHFYGHKEATQQQQAASRGNQVAGATIYWTTKGLGKRLSKSVFRDCGDRGRKIKREGEKKESVRNVCGKGKSRNKARATRNR